MTKGTIVSRRRLLSGAVIGTGIAVVPIVAGVRVFEHGAGGVGGATVPTIGGLSMAAPATGLRSIAAIGSNLDGNQTTYYGVGFPFLDRMKSGSGWQLGNSYATDAQLNANRYPSALPPGDNPQDLVYVNVDGPTSTVKQHYVLRTNKLDVDVTPGLGYSIVSDTGRKNPIRRVVLDCSHPRVDGGYSILVRLARRRTAFGDGKNGRPYEYVELVRADQEALYDGGEIFCPEFLARLAGFSPLRFMDWTNTIGTTLVHWTDRSQVNWSSWAFNAGSVPIEVQVALCNKLGADYYPNLPWTCDEDYAAQLGKYCAAHLDGKLRVLPENSNEVWNFGTPPYGIAAKASTPASGVSGDHSFGNHGYTTARKAAAMLKAMDFSPRVRPMMMGQLYRAEVLEGYIAGAKIAIAEWCDPHHAHYDPALAGRYRYFGQLFTYVGCATYFGANVCEGSLTDDDKRKLLTYADATDGSGVTAILHAIEFGGDFSNNTNSLPELQTALTGVAAVARREQTGLLAYEGGLYLQPNYVFSDADRLSKLADLLRRVSLDNRVEALFTKWMTMVRAAGVTINCHFTDVGIIGTGNNGGAVQDGYHTDTPRQRALKAFAAAPIAASTRPGTARLLA